MAVFCVCLCPYDGVVSLCSEKKKVMWRFEALWLYFDLLEGIICNVKGSKLKHVVTHNYFFFSIRRTLALCQEEEKTNTKTQ